MISTPKLASNAMRVGQGAPTRAQVVRIDPADIRNARPSADGKKLTLSVGTTAERTFTLRPAGVAVSLTGPDGKRATHYLERLEIEGLRHTLNNLGFMANHLKRFRALLSLVSGGMSSHSFGSDASRAALRRAKPLRDGKLVLRPANTEGITATVLRPHEHGISVADEVGELKWKNTDLLRREGLQELRSALRDVWGAAPKDPARARFLAEVETFLSAARRRAGRPPTYEALVDQFAAR